MGNTKLERLPIFTFLIKHEQSGFYLHHNFVTRLLNDLFGIQTRSGCACAGPYAEYLLGISEELAEKYIQVFSKLSYIFKEFLQFSYFSVENDFLKWMQKNFFVWNENLEKHNLCYLKIDFDLHLIEEISRNSSLTK